MVPVFLDDESATNHYEGYCKTVLWPLFHYIMWNDATDGRREAREWNAYHHVNQQFAKVVIENYRKGDIIWVHDYHLLLLPGMIRDRIPDAKIGLFVHAPFPSSEIFRCLPKREEVLRGMVAANQIGYQTFSYARHFISSCTRVLGYESTPNGVSVDGHHCQVGTFPIGIDTDKVNQRRKSPRVDDTIKAIGDLYAGKKIIVGRDKLDLVKGVQQKLEAFEYFLSHYPEWHNKVVLVQATDPAISDSAKLETRVSEMVAHINGTYGSLEFTPLHHFHHFIQPDEYYALLSIADAALITSVRDGMNTTSFEYVMCQEEKQSPLILSEFTGTAGSLSEALLVNPWDHAGVAKAINDALCMSEEEKKLRHKVMHDHVISHKAENWAHSFMKNLMSSIATEEESADTPLLDTKLMYQQYQKAHKRLIFFDYDGTLTPIKKTPGAALPPNDMLQYLQLLCDDPKNIVWVISGRDQSALDKWLGGIRNLGFSAEHGAFMKHPASDKWINLTEHMDMSWKHDVIEIFTYYTERTAGSFIEHKRCSLTWHYRLADPEYGAFQAKECQNHLENAVLSKLPVEILVGKKNLEVRPTSINKGEIVKRLLAASEDADFVLCAGDDKTDEDMFRTLRKSNIPDDQLFSVTVGTEKKTMALWHIPTVQDVIDSMGKLVETNRS
ncbi:hypothetical protein K450DRAFT_177698 [Umbelopsis ramanniana AG]|uniref:Uncharacterized protein n=1 Tax=Umbelopsis ramanniana AG TaxID=1314678 RepID=A0AAD5E596_UMBRA|nr:uncharacterized protein K450DRAFT_177698 [Umbelopsis ramanniana AG]KAI8577448.1 hypothetical protein K450DRAFT_177698 [Umbelopsis ramanniana AG]